MELLCMPLNIGALLLLQLLWAFSQGSATVKVVFDTRWVNLNTTTLQAVVLLTLGKHARMTVKVRRNPCSRC
jgi:hypothetical protein